MSALPAIRPSEIGIPEILQGYNDALEQLDFAGDRLGCLAAQAVQEKLRNVEAYIQKQAREYMLPYDSFRETLEYCKHLVSVGIKDDEERRAYETGDQKCGGAQ